MIRIAYVCADPGIPVLGSKGASVHVQEVVRAFVRAGIEVVLLATRWGGETPDDLHSAGFKPLPPVAKGDAEARARSSLANNAALRDALTATGPFDLVYERYSLWSYAGMAYASEARIPGILEVNAPLIEEQEQHRELAMRGEAELVAASVFADATALVAVSPGVAEYLNQHAAAQGRVHVIANGIDPDRFERFAYRSYANEHEPLTIGFLGTLKPWHGLSTLIESCALLRRDYGVQFNLLIVGDGPERDRVEADIAAYGLKSVARLTGAVSPRSIPSLLSEMDIATAPYPALSNFYFSPLKIYEYMAAGLAIVASRVGHLDKIIRDGEDGVLCPPDDPPALAAAIAHLACRPDLRRRLGLSSRNRALNDHTWASVADRILTLAGLDLSAATQKAVA